MTGPCFWVSHRLNSQFSFAATSEPLKHMPGDDAVCTNLCSLIYELQEYIFPLLTDGSGVLYVYQ
jgi:hypothetical protein